MGQGGVTLTFFDSIDEDWLEALCEGVGIGSSENIKNRDERTYKKLLGVPALFGEQGFTALEQRSARPTLEINGLTSGYQGEGSKTIVPAWAKAKLTLRLVPNQTPASILKRVSAHLRKICPPGVRLALEPGHGADPYLVSPSSPLARAALRSLRKSFHWAQPVLIDIRGTIADAAMDAQEEIFGARPVRVREGGSIPIVNEFSKILGVDTLLLGLGLPDDNMHSPNEKFDLDCFHRGQLMSAHLWQELSTAV